MNDINWMIETINHLKQQTSNYDDQAFYQELSVLINEQQQRYDQMSGELDGRMWAE